MKNQQSDQSLDDTILSIESMPGKTCPLSKEATLVCYNRKCTNIAFICADKSCQCYNVHAGCPHVSIESIINSIKTKIIPFKHFQEFILDKIHSTIDQLSDLKQKLQTEIQRDFTLYGLSSKDKDLFYALNKQEMTGKDFFEYFNKAINFDIQQAEKESLDTIFADLWESIDREISVKSTQFFNILQTIKKNQSIKPFLIDIRMLKDSKIVTTEKSVRHLMQMFGDKMPQSAKLLYRASEENFKTIKFHEKCDKIPYTLTLCETVHGKVIGGYTPLAWNRSKNSQRLKDESGSSFIFSLSNNHKFLLGQFKDAIYLSSVTGPWFGNGDPDFYIVDSANQHNSYAKINQSYFNNNYTAGNADSYIKFTGNPDKSYNYRAKEWQVWELEFK